MQLAQLGFSFLLAFVAIADNPSLALIAICVFAVGISNALGAPGLRNGLLQDLPGRIGLRGLVRWVLAIGAQIIKHTETAQDRQIHHRDP